MSVVHLISEHGAYACVIRDFDALKSTVTVSGLNSGRHLHFKSIRSNKNWGTKNTIWSVTGHHTLTLQTAFLSLMVAVVQEDDTRELVPPPLTRGSTGVVFTRPALEKNKPGQSQFQAICTNHQMAALFNYVLIQPLCLRTSNVSLRIAS